MTAHFVRVLHKVSPYFTRKLCSTYLLFDLAQANCPRIVDNFHTSFLKVIMEPLFASAPGFDQPLAVLKHCHDRIRKQLTTLEKLLPHLTQNGADKEAQQAATAVLRYFQNAAPLHHEDEENDLLPELKKTAQAQDAMLLADLLPTILQQHGLMAEQWHKLEKQLTDIASGTSSDLNHADIAEFIAIYQEHMRIEETQIAPMAARIFSLVQMQALGAAMQNRRGINAA
jgi:pyridoxamine 5'-phosphate oxidase